MRHILGEIKEGLVVSLSARSIISCGSNPSQSIIRICVPSNQVDRTAPSLQVQPPFLSTHLLFFVHPPPSRHYFTQNKEKRDSAACRFRGCALRTRIHCLSATRNISTTKDLNWFQEGNSNLFKDFYYSSSKVTFLQSVIVTFALTTIYIDMCTLQIIVCLSEILGKSHLLGYLKSIMTEKGTSCG